MNESLDLREVKGNRCASVQWLSPLCEPRTCRRMSTSAPYVSLVELASVSRRKVPHVRIEQLPRWTFMGGFSR